MICDRCKKSYRILGESLAKIYLRKVNEDDQLIEAKIDLCPSCVRDFKLWVREGKKKEGDKVNVNSN